MPLQQLILPGITIEIREEILNVSDKHRPRRIAMYCCVESLVTNRQISRTWGRILALKPKRLTRQRYISQLLDYQGKSHAALSLTTFAKSRMPQISPRIALLTSLQVTNQTLFKVISQATTISQVFYSISSAQLCPQTSSHLC